jgi:hypothetical protein
MDKRRGKYLGPHGTKSTIFHVTRVKKKRRKEKRKETRTR